MNARDAWELASFVVTALGLPFAIVFFALEEMLKRILNSRVYDVARKTPLDQAHRLSRRLHNQLVL